MSANPTARGIAPSRTDEIAASTDFLIRSNSFPLLLRTPKRLSDDELLEFCAANDLLRIERNSAGELILMTPAGGKTSNRESYLSRELDIWAEQNGSGIAFNANGGFSLPDGSVRAADAAWLLSRNGTACPLKNRASSSPSARNLSSSSARPVIVQ